MSKIVPREITITVDNSVLKARWQSFVFIITVILEFLNDEISFTLPGNQTLRIFFVEKKLMYFYAFKSEVLQASTWNKSWNQTLKMWKWV